MNYTSAKIFKQTAFCEVGVQLNLEYIDPRFALFSSSSQAQRKELFIQERYGRYNVSDPFLALQRDTEALGGQNKDQGCSSTTSNPLVVLRLVVSHCRRMQEKMLAQLAAAESRHRRVGVDQHFLTCTGRNPLPPYADLSLL